MENYIVRELLNYCNVQQRDYMYYYKRPVSYYVLSFVLEGSLVCTVNDTEYVLNKNDAVFLKPGMVREYIQQGNKPLWFVHFNFETLDGFDLSLPTYLPNSFSSDMKRLIQIFPYSHIPSDKFSKQKLTNLLNYILLELLEKDSYKSQNAYINEIIKIIDEKLTEKLTLQSISSRLNLSKEYISYIFKKETGKTLTNYINEQKMTVAKEFVINSGMPLVEISQSLGFDNYNYFSRLFKKYFYRTPIDMRKKG